MGAVDETGMQGDQEKPSGSGKDAAIGCGLTLCIAAIAVIVTLMVTGVLGSRSNPAADAPAADYVADAPADSGVSTYVEPPASWTPPEWLTGYWSTDDGWFQVAAEPGFVDVIAYGDGSMVSYTVHEEDGGDMFSITAFADGDSDSLEWGLTRRGYREGGQEWAAQALHQDESVAVDLTFRYLSENLVMLVVTVGEEQVAVRLRRDE